MGKKWIKYSNKIDLLMTEDSRPVLTIISRKARRLLNEQELKEVGESLGMRV